MLSRFFLIFILVISNLSISVACVSSKNQTEIIAVQKYRVETQQSNEIEFEYTYIRKIQFRYSLDLGLNNSKAKTLINTISDADKNLRRCYVTQLNKNQDLRGLLEFQITIKGRKALVDQLAQSGSTIENKMLSDCLKTEIELLRFPKMVSSRKLTGKLRYYFKSWIPGNVIEISAN